MKTTSTSRSTNGTRWICNHAIHPWYLVLRKNKLRKAPEWLSTKDGSYWPQRDLRDTTRVDSNSGAVFGHCALQINLAASMLKRTRNYPIRELGKVPKPKSTSAVWSLIRTCRQSCIGFLVRTHQTNSHQSENQQNQWKYGENQIKGYAE